MKTTGAKIKFNAFSDYNFVIEVESTSVIKALDGLSMLQDELPAEISFYVPEMYHKRIIGVGGKNIQRIMKKYGVYVKFSNAEEFAALGGYYDNDDNVVARTPMKNQVNLDNLRHAVMELITQRDKDYVNQTVSIPFRMHRALLRDQGNYFADVTKKTLTRIMWPDHELASDTVTLVGPLTEIEHAIELVQAVVPEEYDVVVPRSSALTAALASDNFHDQVVVRLERECGIQIDIQNTPQPPPSISSSSPSPSVPASTTATTAAPAVSGSVTTGSPVSLSAPTSPSRSTPAPSTAGSPTATGSETDYTIPLKMSKCNIRNLPSALDILISYLRNHNVTLYDNATPKTSRTTPTSATLSASNVPLVDSFSHFGSKVLPSVSGKVYQFVYQDVQMLIMLLIDIGSGTGNQKLHHSFSSFSLFDFAPGTSTSTGSHHAFDTPWTSSFRDMNSPRTAENIRAIFDSPPHKQDEMGGAMPKQRMSVPVMGGQNGAPGLGVFRAPNGGATSASGSSSLGGGADIWLPQQLSQMSLSGHPHLSATGNSGGFGNVGLGTSTSAAASANNTSATTGGASGYDKNRNRVSLIRQIFIYKNNTC